MTTNREKTLRLALLNELAHTPAGYLQPAAALTGSMRFYLCPPPEEQELTAALTRLENDGLLTRVDNPLHGPRYAITDTGRAALKS